MHQHTTQYQIKYISFAPVDVLGNIADILSSPMNNNSINRSYYDALITNKPRRKDACHFVAHGGKIQVYVILYKTLCENVLQI